MSHQIAQREFEKFLCSPDPEVLSISGRWGVGKTHAWDSAVKANKEKAALRRYAYVSAFGLQTIDDLRTAIFQSTVSLDGPEIEPTLESFTKVVTTLDGAKNFAETATRNGWKFLSQLWSATPIAGKANIFTPAASLLIRNQIVCIDDIERAGKGLDIGDILGLVSHLRERRGCKVVLLLNKEGLGSASSTFDEYVEKVVDRAVSFQPTAAESAKAALGGAGISDELVTKYVVALGITNIRVIRRIGQLRRELQPFLQNTQPDVIDRFTKSLVLLSWCVFEKNLAPDIDLVTRHSRSGPQHGEDPVKNPNSDSMLAAYGFGSFEFVDAVLLAGLRDGTFDDVRLGDAIASLRTQFLNKEARLAIFAPWRIFSD